MYGTGPVVAPVPELNMHPVISPPLIMDFDVVVPPTR
jgi:hypothetical protein